MSPVPADQVDATTTPMTSLPDRAHDGKRPHGLMQVVKAGASYFLVAMGSGFVLEVIRMQVVALHVSERLAEMMEIPNVLLATIVGARWVIDRFTLPPLPGIRLSVGLVALCLMLLLEWAVVLPLHGLSFREYVAGQEMVVGTVPLGALGVLTVMPFLVGYRWER